MLSGPTLAGGGGLGWPLSERACECTGASRKGMCWAPRCPICRAVISAARRGSANARVRSVHTGLPRGATSMVPATARRARGHTSCAELESLSSAPPSSGSTMYFTLYCHTRAMSFFRIRFRPFLFFGLCFFCVLAKVSCLRRKTNITQAPAGQDSRLRGSPRACGRSRAELPRSSPADRVANTDLTVFRPPI